MEPDGGRVRRVATLIFSDPDPFTNLLVQVIQDGFLDHWFPNPLVTGTCRLRSVLVVGWLVGWPAANAYLHENTLTHCYLESSG